MPMKYFKVLQPVLSQTRDVICDVHGLSKDEAFKKAEEFVKENSQKWRLPDPAIKYEDPFCRMAYLYMNVAIHASLVENALFAFPTLKTMFLNKIDSSIDLRICALGGGPGAELLGVVRFIEQLKLSRVAYLDFLLVDRIKEWDESWHALKQGVDQQLKIEYGTDRNKWPTSVSRSFLSLDLTSPRDFVNFATRFNGIDLFILCYVLSELKAFLAGEFATVLDFLVNRAAPQALFLFVDRDEREIRTGIQGLIENNAQLSLVDVKEDRGRLQDDPADLGEWYINLPSLPRQKWLVFSALAQKQ
jgi:hypothetical protein